MSKRPRRNHTPAFRARAAVKGEKMLAELAQQSGCRPRLSDAVAGNLPQRRSTLMEPTMSARSITTRRRVVSATGIVCASFAWPVAAQPMVCPMPQTTSGPGVLTETPVQIAQTGKVLASGNGVNRVPEVVADLRKRYPGASDAELENYLVTAYCPEVAKLDGLSAGEQRARVNLFARQASMAVYGH